MKLSAYAAEHGVTYRTAWNWYHAGLITGTQMPTGTILIDGPVNGVNGKDLVRSEAAVVYTRVSSAENKANLAGQADRVTSYCAARGWKVRDVVKEIGSGLNDHRPKLLKILTDPSVLLVVVEHKDRLTRFGFAYIEALLAQRGGRIEIINEAGSAKEDLIQDFVSVITSFCARIYGQRRAKRKTMQLLAELEGKAADEARST